MKRCLHAGCVLMLALVAFADCGVLECKKGTLWLELALKSGATATEIVVTAHEGAKTFSAKVSDPLSGLATIELSFSEALPYQENKSLQLTIAIKYDDKTEDTFDKQVVLKSDCTKYSFDLSSTDLPLPDLTGVLPPDLEVGRTDGVLDASAMTPDQAAPDLSGLETNDLANADDAAQSDLVSPDLRPVEDLRPTPVCDQDEVRCNPDDHRKQQNCVDGQWIDLTCVAPGSPTNPPVYACTEAAHRCVDTEWVQWSLAAAPPTPRFSTIASTGTVGEDMIFDALTGLTWQLKNTVSPSYTYDQAVARCAGLTYGGRTGDWRVPSRIELGSLLDRSVATAPFVKPPFRSDTGSFYWASGVFNGGITNRWAGYFSSGSMGDYPPSGMANVRCVR